MRVYMKNKKTLAGSIREKKHLTMTHLTVIVTGSNGDPVLAKALVRIPIIGMYTKVVITKKNEIDGKRIIIARRVSRATAIGEEVGMCRRDESGYELNITYPSSR